MKRAVSLLTISLLLSLSMNAQAKKWPEMEAFHTVMGATFHSAEEGKLDPIKKRSGELAEKATAWLHSEAPEGFNKTAVKLSLKKLAKEANELDRLVKSNASDEVLTRKLGSLHDLFHGIEEKCEK